LPPSKGVKMYFLQGYEAFDYMPVERVERTWTFPMRKIVVSRWLADIASKRFGDKNVFLVPNGVDREQFFADPRGKQKRLTIGVVYSDMRIKGLDVAFAALDTVRREEPDLRFVAFGNSPPSRHLPLPSYAEYFCKPPQDRLRDLYAMCDAWLFPSREEGFGLPVLEAMACRTPVIAAPAGAAPELLAEGGGILLPECDAGRMAKAIIQIRDMADTEWRELSERAYRIARSYSWESAGERFENALLTAWREHSGEGCCV